MDCRETSQWISDAVDNRLRGALKHAFFEHLETCKNCRGEYEMEHLTKDFIRRRLTSVTAPAAVRSHILEMLAGETAARSSRLTFQSLFASRTVRYSVAVAFAILLILVGVNVLDEGPGPYGDVLANTMRNYDAMREGQLKPQMVAFDAEEVQKYFDAEASFHVMVPVIQECAFISGLISTLDGLQEAHILYKMDEDTYLYCYQVDVDKVMEDRMLNVPDEAMPVLKENKCFVKKMDDRTLILWISEDNLCAAVSGMDQSEMMELLAMNH